MVASQAATAAQRFVDGLKAPEARRIYTMRVEEILDRLPGDIRAIAEQHANKEYRRRTVAESVKGVDEDERLVEHWVSTPDVDRVKEILLPKGANLTEAHTVFWGHDYDKVIGSIAWQKRKKEGVLAKTVFATTPFADEKFQLVKDGHVKTWSVGYIPLESFWKGFDDDYDKVAEKVQAQYSDINVSEAMIITSKWLELEYSLVGVPTNPNAVNRAIQKGLWTNDDIVSSGLDVEGPPTNEIKPEAKRVTVLLDVPPARYVELIQPARTVKCIETKRSIEEQIRDEIDRLRGRV